MSAFLGPIHIKMYDRILYQDEMAETLLSLQEVKDWVNDLRTRADAQAPKALKEPLEKIIDQNAIHGWLSKAVANCEFRFALIASNILSEHPERLGELQSVLAELGRQYPLPEHPDAERAFQAIHDILLDGMPCDFPFNIDEIGSEAVSWQVTSCPHAPYWQNENCSSEVYYQLRDAWVAGALENSGITHARSGNNHTLRKEQ